MMTAQPPMLGAADGADVLGLEVMNKLGKKRVGVLR
jgi:hypothetical protein